MYNACEHDTEKKLIYQPELSKKVHFIIFKIRYNVGMAAPGHVAEDSTADLLTQHGLCCLQRHVLPFFEGHVSENSTGRAALRGLPCCFQQHGQELPAQHCILF